MATMSFPGQPFVSFGQRTDIACGYLRATILTMSKSETVSVCPNSLIDSLIVTPRIIAMHACPQVVGKFCLTSFMLEAVPSCVDHWLSWSSQGWLGAMCQDVFLPIWPAGNDDVCLPNRFCDFSPFGCCHFLTISTPSGGGKFAGFHPS